MGLHGGGEEPMTSGSTGWGSLPPMNSSSPEWGYNTPNTNTNHWPNNSRQISNCDQTLSTSPKPSGSWAQAAGKGLINGPNGPNHDLNAFGNNNGFQTNDNSTKARNNSDFGQINEIKDSALISDNWGSTVINQDSPWKLPPSPQSSPKECGSASQWKSSTSSGTEIWENTVRHKSKGPTPTPAAVSGQPWGNHTPSTHIGGTWGEEEDTSNHWTGVPQINNSNNSNNSNSSWQANTNVSNNTNGNNNNNPSNMCSNMQWSQSSDNKIRDNSENSSRHSSEVVNTRPKVSQGSNASWSDFNEQPDSAPSEPVWNESKSNDSFGTWVPESTQKKSDGSAWDKDSNDSRSGNFDDGTAVWGNPTRQGKVSRWAGQESGEPREPRESRKPIGANLHNSNNNPNAVTPAMMAPSPGMIRLPNVAPISAKNGDTWGKPSPPNPSSRGNSWSDGSTHRDSPSNNSGSLWSDSDNKNNANRTPNTPNWVDSNSSPLAYWAAKPKATNPNPNWSDGQIDTSSWGGPKQGKPLSRDIIWASKQFRILTDMGFKKDDVENALRNSSMKLEDAIIELKSASSRDSNLDSDLLRFKSSGMSSNTPSLLSNTSGIANSSLTSISRTPVGSIVQPPHQASAQSFSQANQVPSALVSNQAGSRAGGSAQSNSLPNVAQLRVLVQQIQLAVQAGHLNAQILNQPLAPHTLQLLYQLLQQIKILHQLQISANQPNLLSKTGATNAASVPAIQSSINVQITQTKQRILNLQNQIAAQQAIFLKEQQHQSQIGQQPTPNAVNVGLNANQTTPMHSQQTSNNDFFKSSQPDNSLVISNDRDISSQSVSRFQTTWKPSFNKDENKVNVNLIPNEFSRAPGPLPKQNNSLLDRISDITNWTGFSGGDPTEPSGWPSDSISISASNALNIQKHNEMKDISNSLPSPIQPSIQDPYNLNDFVPEFEPGKPWKGNSSLKNIEDDPTITPGSVNRSPLSINTIKDPLFNWPSKLSPETPNSSAVDNSLLSLSSSTWAFTPPSNPHIYNTVDNNKPKNNVKSPSNWASLIGYDELQMSSCNDNLWSTGSISKTRGPPPGLAPQIKSPATTLSNSGSTNPIVSSAHNLWNAGW